MDAFKFEQYCFLRLYAIDLDTAVHTIKVLRRHKRADAQYPLLRDIAVTYARPFSGNEGKKINRHHLSTRHVPATMRDLHSELLRLRKEQFAHTDLKFYRPNISKFHGELKSRFPMSLKSYDYESLLKKLPEIESLIHAVDDSIQAEMAAYEASV
ncbi:hypothetical protein SB394_07150 [Burkholderia sp. BCCIQ04A]|uniref:HEPN AbiU2-like domain-containing protein n=1 Tax=Burkholderia anthinoferrum TaxID=3090833 RepID=A0ABU5WGB9_9BURK|nr:MULTISPECIES: hypothetical protein [Burkholderia]MEB2502238.1 hypothetical protein [Burkholderia anthinoferrum]MEB2530596.1 hypothetical protein [Burkholderia anthinoferrum]MEB2559302.1 hypothetical protein [Burkholderia anthinoferrum]MEB2578049.1 hypothetical protein [Burkholderia anthinoferrum]MCA8032675.1 hypothetical protein [Burkholderia arboris]